MSVLLWIMVGTALVTNLAIAFWLAFDDDDPDELPRETAEEVRVAIIVADYLRAMNEERYEDMEIVWANVHNVPGLEAALHELHAGLMEEVV